MALAIHVEVRGNEKGIKAFLVVPDQFEVLLAELNPLFLAPEHKEQMDAFVKFASDAGVSVVAHSAANAGLKALKGATVDITGLNKHEADAKIKEAHRHLAERN